MNHRELRRTFLEFFAERGHKIVPSASLIPKDDPSLLFTGAGMVQFKPYWAGTVELPYRRACSIQKCLRASDLEQVGKTPRHLTFFEMMGNFSFGDYFKAEGIKWAWEYLTEVVRLDPDRLYPTVLQGDDEAYEVWRKQVGLPEERVFRLGPRDNFWGPVGGGGACGPCSEIHFDLGEEMGCGRAGCQPGCECKRWTEVYNVVFPQFNQLPDGTREPLKNRGIDTGMGLERLAMASQGKQIVFDSDLFMPLVRETAKTLRGSSDLEPRTSNFSMMLNVAVDHARALTFAITDGVVPSNETRGYVLRSILRRALLFAHKQGVRQPFLYRVSGAVVEHMKQFYPELVAKREQAALIIRAEEERFLRTLEAGLERWEQVLKKHRDGGVVPGEELFRLHDTFGFHIELVKELAGTERIGLDTLGFERAMEEQRERSKKSMFTDLAASAGVDAATTAVAFVGYEKDEVETELLRCVPLEGEKLFEVYLKNTPFYTEAGGQVGDTGRIAGAGFELRVLDSYYKQGVRVSKARLVSGEVAVGPVKAVVDRERRREIERAHTATHLLHAALRRVVGDYVKQEGSLVEPGRLRFDFAAFEPLSPEQLSAVERLVYEQVIADRHLERQVDVPVEKAKAMGALAFFGEQYGEMVTVVRIPGFSAELCGGTHLRSTGEIGLFRISAETGVAAGIRRIEALVGKAAYARAVGERETVNRLKALLGSGDDVLVQKAESVTEEVRRLESRVRQLSALFARSAAEELAEKAEVIRGTRVVFGYLPQLDSTELRTAADRLRELLKSDYAGLIAGGVSENRLRYIVFVSPELESTMPAGRLAKVVGQALGGGGGGKPDLAEGGGSLDRLASGQEAFRAALSGWLASLNRG